MQPWAPSFIHPDIYLLMLPDASWLLWAKPNQRSSLPCQCTSCLPVSHLGCVVCFSQWQTPHPNGSSQRHCKPQALLFSFCYKRTTCSHFLPEVKKTCGGELPCNMTEKYWVGQEVHLGFSVTSYGKTRTNFLANPVHLGCYKLPRFGSVGTTQNPWVAIKVILS